jgi:alpha-galactosidase
VDIAWDVAELCPDAFFFNYANPMACITRAVNQATPVGLIGLCHGVQGTLRYLCNLIGVPYAEVGALYCGINHLTFITHFTRAGESLWPQVDAKLGGAEWRQPDRRHPAQGRIPAIPPPVCDPSDNPFAWELYRTHGAFPAVLDRHITEFYSPRFASGAYYGKQLGVDVMDILGVIHGGDDRYAKMKAQAEGREPLEDSLFERTLGEHEALIPILESVFADRQQLFPMNVPNTTVPEVPPDFVLEMPTCATRAGCVPIAMPPLRPALAATITRALYGVELTVEAALTGDRQTLIEALLYDGCVLELARAEGLADDLLAAHKDHLPQFA